MSQPNAKSESAYLAPLYPWLKDGKTPKTSVPVPVAVVGEIVAVSKNTPPKLSGKTAKSVAPEAEFADAGHWGALAERYLPYYELPRWCQPATADALGTWLDRMELPKRVFLRTGNYRDLQDAIDLNTTWPLRALIGLALETKHEQMQERGQALATERAA